jgi:hypothetical protein
MIDAWDGTSTVTDEFNVWYDGLSEADDDAVSAAPASGDRSSIRLAAHGSQT